MFKFLLLIAVLGLVVWFYRRTTKPVARSGRAAQPSPAPVESMVACAHCHVRFPRGEALCEADETYCCEAHRRLGKR